MVRESTANSYELLSKTYLLTVNSADTTLEGSNAEGTFSGNGAVHQCKDWDSVTEFLVENRANDFQRSILHT